MTFVKIVLQKLEKTSTSLSVAELVRSEKTRFAKTRREELLGASALVSAVAN